ncbi:UNVERIFIED_CONTAM: hypothetical protein RMT77_017203 [Armadillidium vulgare]
MIESREWTFRVSCHVDPGESVFVTGSCDVLGSWSPCEIIHLQLEGSSEEPIWSTTLQIPQEEVEYRFGVCVGIRQLNEIIYAVKRWETHLHPRVIPPNETNTSCPEVQSFGYINEYYKVDQGWLNKEYSLFLKLGRSNLHNDPIILWKKKHKNKKCFLKVTPIDISKTSSIDPMMELPTDDSTEVELMELRTKSKSLLPIVEVSVLKEDMSQFRYQEQFGVLCTDEDMIVFQCRLASPESIGFLFDYYVEMESEVPPCYIGCSFVLPSTYKDCYGVATLPISSTKHTPIGQLTVSYMLVHPLKEFKCDMKVSYAKYWKETWKGLEVGHRGAGNSFHSQTKNCANIRENTIASLKYAYDNGADMVEFDVQLSKDLVPVIYHDFYAYIALKRKKEALQSDLMEIPIKDLTLAQLQALKVYHLKEKGITKFDDEDTEDHQPFPTLKQAFESVPLSCGFNIELKWTNRLVDGSYELQHPFELNRFLDTILKIVLESSSPRKIIFSCFHPDICTMIRLKQNLYPVLFLTQGENKSWPSYDDVRSKSIRNAVLYASSADILGVNMNTEDLLRDTNQVQMVFDHNQVAFCWGDQNSDRETFNLVKDLGMHGIIYDKIGDYNKKSERSSVFLCDDKETCRCFPFSCKPNHKNDQTSSHSPSEREVSPSSSGERSPTLSDEPLPKRQRTEEHSKEISTNGASPTSFCGVLNHS